MPTYVNPLQHANITDNNRVDEGVDYGVDGGYLVAIGDYRVTYSSNAATGWPGGQVQYLLTEPGPLQGAYIYYAEGVTMWKNVGDVGRWGDGICALYSGAGHSIEIGFGSNNPPDSWVRDSGGGYDGANSPNGGIAFNNLLRALGAPTGIVQGTPTGPSPPWTLTGSGIRPGPGTPAPPINVNTDQVVGQLDPSKEVRDIADQWSIHGSRTYNHANAIADLFRHTSYIDESGPR